MANLVYRKTIERFLYVLSLAGVGLTIHIILWYEVSNLGSGDPFCGIDSNCAGIIANDPAPFGIPSAWWGVLFYAILGVGTLLIAQNIDGWKKKLMLGRAILVGLGWLYSLFLTILQVVAIDGWCQLCIFSFSIATLIAIFTFTGLFMRSSPNISSRAPTNRGLFHGAVAMLLLVFLVWDIVNVSGTGDSVEPTMAGEENIDPAMCTYDPESPPFDNVDLLVTEYDPIKGSVDAPILVLEFLDPNCNHCKAVHPNIKAVADEYSDLVRVVYKPVPIVGGPTHSLDEITALYFANEQGMFEEMLDLIFRYQSPATGLSIDRLAEFADDLGLDESDFRRALSERRYSSMTVQTRRIFEGMGFTGVPVIIVNDREISSSSRNIGCLRHFVEQAKLQL